MAAVRDLHVEQLLDLAELVAQERQPDARAEEPRAEALGRELEPALLEPSRLGLLTAVHVRHRLDEQRA